MRPALLLLLVLGCGAREAPRTQTGAPPPVATQAAAPAAGCAVCHAAEAEEWRASLHHRAFDDRDFQASFAIEPADFCFRCHAPEAKDRRDHLGASNGVGCMSCHAVAAATGPKHATTRSCDGCHEFTFPGSATLMQSTASEHAASAFGDVACATCHAPRRADGRRDHRFDVTRNLPLLRAALAVDAERTPEGISVRLTSRNVGHAMPTGDLFRRLRVVVSAEDATGRLLGDDEAILGRRFPHGKNAAPERSRDDRIVGTRTVRLDGDWLVRAAKIAIDVRYERVAHTDDADLAPRPSARHEALFASESLATIELTANHEERSR